MATLAFEIYLPCPRCTTSVPMNALAPRLTCGACQAEVVPEKLLEQFQREHFWARLMLGRSVSAEADLSVKGSVSWAEPLCPGCRAPLTLPAALDAASASGQVECAACRMSITVRCVPSQLIPAEIDYLTHLIGEEPSLLPGAAATVGPRAGAQPVLFPCPSCNASLPIDGSSRTVECTYCRANAYLPDDLWRKLHPVRTISPWYLNIDLDSPRVGAYRRADRRCSWCTRLFGVLLLGAMAAFFILSGPLRWAAGGTLLLGALTSGFLAVRSMAQSEGDHWP